MTTMVAVADWQSPAATMDTLFDVREAGCEDIGFALLRPRARQQDNAAGRLIRSKLAPVKPDAGARSTPCGVGVTARDYRLVLARGVADQPLGRLLDDYDAMARPHQTLLAAVLTVRGDADMPTHDLFDMAAGYASINVARGRQLTSVVVLHTPGDELSNALPHVHVCMLARQHHPSGWSAVHGDLADTTHRLWAEEWRRFTAAWQQIPAIG